MVVKWQRCRDGVKVLGVSFPSSLVGFWGFHPYMHLFPFRKLFVTCYLTLTTSEIFFPLYTSLKCWCQSCVFLSTCSTDDRPCKASKPSSDCQVAESWSQTGCASWPTGHHSKQLCSLSWPHQSMSDQNVWVVVEKQLWVHLWESRHSTWCYRQEGSCIESLSRKQ